MCGRLRNRYSIPDGRPLDPYALTYVERVHDPLKTGCAAVADG